MPAKTAIIRHELSELEQALQLARRKEIYERKYPETKAGVAQAIGMHRVLGNNVAEIISATFTADTAAKVRSEQRKLFPLHGRISKNDTMSFLSRQRRGHDVRNVAGIVPATSKTETISVLGAKCLRKLFP